MSFLCAERWSLQGETHPETRLLGSDGQKGYPGAKGKPQGDNLRICKAEEGMTGIDERVQGFLRTWRFFISGHLKREGG